MALILDGSNDTITGLQINSANIVNGSIVNEDINDLAASKLTGALPAISGAALTNLDAGKILQVKQTFKNDTASTSSGSFSDISGLTVSITPSATSSKILYKGSLYLGYTGAEGNFRLKRTIGGTATDIGVSSVLDDDADGSFAIGGSSLYVTANFEFLDSPNTTSAITYGIRWHMHSGTMYLNRTWDSGWFHGASSITAMEVAA